MATKKRARAARYPATKRMALHGRIVVVYYKDGRVTTRKWPRSNKASQTPRQKLIVDQMTQVIQFAKAPLPQDYQAAADLSVGTAYTWRDIYTLACFGKLIRCHTSDGKTWMGIRMAYGDIQALLDSISNVPGTLIVRGQTEWEAILPGAANDVLTSTGPTTTPAWTKPQGGGGYGGLPVYLSPAIYTSASSGVNTAILRSFSIAAGQPISGVGWVPGTTNPTAAWSLALYKQNGIYDITSAELIWQSGEQIGTVAQQWTRIPVDPTWVADQNYNMFAAVVHDGSVNAGYNDYNYRTFSLSTRTWPATLPATSGNNGEGVAVIPYSTDPFPNL